MQLRPSPQAKAALLPHNDALLCISRSIPALVRKADESSKTSSCYTVRNRIPVFAILAVSAKLVQQIE